MLKKLWRNYYSILIIFLFTQQILTHSHEPNSIQALYSCAYHLKEQGRMHEALPYYEKVLAQQPNHAHAHIGSAQAYLALGNFERGWHELCWRFNPPLADIFEFKNYLEQGKSLRNKIILLRAEWGIGDTLQMLRYAQLLKESGAVVKLALLHKSLVPLLTGHPWIDELVPPGTPLPPFHFQVPMMSLPFVFNTSTTTIPTPLPYLFVDQQRIDLWRKQLNNNNSFNKKSFNIGICWHGNTIHDPEKFMPLHYFAQLAQLPNIQLYSLQQHHGLEQLQQLTDPTAVTVFDDSFDAVPFLDTAALMHTLDLVITVDTSIAHLAGAQHIPTWIVLPHTADWRWMIGRNDSPWYPSVTLFRQKYKNEWNTIIEKMKRILS